MAVFRLSPIDHSADRSGDKPENNPCDILYDTRLWTIRRKNGSGKTETLSADQNRFMTLLAENHRGYDSKELIRELGLKGDSRNVASMVKAIRNKIADVLDTEDSERDAESVLRSRPYRVNAVYEEISDCPPEYYSEVTRLLIRERHLAMDPDDVQIKYARLLKEYRKLDGFPPADNEAGRFYLFGWGVRQNFPAAMALFRSAAEGNYAYAQYNLASMYENGWGTEDGQPDHEQALYWFRKGAENTKAPDEDCMLQLARMYREGIGTPPDPVQADEWELRAATASMERHTIVDYFQEARRKKEETDREK